MAALFDVSDMRWLQVGAQGLSILIEVLRLVAARARAMAPDKTRHGQHQHQRPRRRKAQRSGGHCDPAAAAPNAFAPHSSLKDFPDSFGEALSGGGALLGGKLQRSLSGESMPLQTCTRI